MAVTVGKKRGCVARPYANEKPARPPYGTLADPILLT